MGADPRTCKKEEIMLHTFNIYSDSTKFAEFPELSKPVLLYRVPACLLERLDTKAQSSFYP